MKIDFPEDSHPVTRWLSERTTLERIGLGALTVAGGAVAASLLFPNAAAVVGGSVLGSLGALLLGRGFRR